MVQLPPIIHTIVELSPKAHLSRPTKFDGPKCQRGREKIPKALITKSRNNSTPKSGHETSVSVQSYDRLWSSPH